MKIHEYQAKKILSEFKIPVPKGDAASTPQEAREIAQRLGGGVVVKAQVHAGGRGKAGGVRVVSSAEEAKQFTASLLGKNLVTFQTGPQGVSVRQVLVEEAMDIEKELYLAILIDSQSLGPVIVASEAGGMEIEQVAARSPGKILQVQVDPVLGVQPFQGRKLTYGMGLKPELVRPITDLVSNLYQLFVAKDCSLAEINPLVVTKDGRLLALDAKLNFDDDALFRHGELRELQDTSQEDPLEVEAAKYDIQYIKLDGDVGCMVNGAGLAMATMDTTKKAGAEPANFLDVGGGADEQKISQAFKIILSDPKVKRILINIFGGILRCDVAARGIVTAAQEMGGVKVPIVVRMSGTNVKEGREILSSSALKVTLVNDLGEAAKAIKTSIG
ncbi:MAG: ADP-forming succinate--CoA ligase subunit beta [Chloroflexi bacterium]|nr:ADP-forming succinate--CoA ligase subunit beta [Chloroflexota bacterium]